MDHANPADFPQRHALALAELERLRSERAAQVAVICNAGLSAEEQAIVDQYVRNLQGPLGDAWAAFLNETCDSQRAALEAPTFANLPWHSLLQCNPYAMLPRWVPIRPRAYA